MEVNLEDLGSRLQTIFDPVCRGSEDEQGVGQADEELSGKLCLAAMMQAYSAKGVLAT